MPPPTSHGGFKCPECGSVKITFEYVYGPTTLLEDFTRNVAKIQEDRARQLEEIESAYSAFVTSAVQKAEQSKDKTKSDFRKQTQFQLEAKFKLESKSEELSADEAAYLLMAIQDDITAIAQKKLSGIRDKLNADLALAESKKNDHLGSVRSEADQELSDTHERLHSPANRVAVVYCQDCSHQVGVTIVPDDQMQSMGRITEILRESTRAVQAMHMDILKCFQVLEKTLENVGSVVQQLDSDVDALKQSVSSIIQRRESQERSAAVNQAIASLGNVLSQNRSND